MYFTSNNSLFKWKKTGDTSLKSTPDGNYTSAAHLKDGEFNYVDLTDRTIISKGFVSLNEAHLIKQKLPEIHWEIMPEKKTIGDYTCTKARGLYMGRNYTVWFTNEIPVSYGPWKLQGLPGLILEAFDDANEINFKLKNITTNDELLTVDLKNKELITLEKYYQRVIDYPFELLRRVQAKAKRGTTVSITHIDYNFLEKDYEILGDEEFRNK